MNYKRERILRFLRGEQKPVFLRTIIVKPYGIEVSLGIRTYNARVFQTKIHKSQINHVFRMKPANTFSREKRACGTGKKVLNSHP